MQLATTCVCGKDSDGAAPTRITWVEPEANTYYIISTMMKVSETDSCEYEIYVKHRNTYCISDEKHKKT